MLFWCLVWCVGVFFFFSVGVIVIYAMCLVWCVDDIFYISVVVLLFLLRVWYGVMFIFCGFVVFLWCVLYGVLMLFF